ncbi:MAG: T9SS type A sorting domain-containing protein [Flavobacteriales bacterium]|jgi:hypothetical protein|nr:T9SS type A sorting domain-containing protein [Flavobacteriales bacterium]
MELQTRFDEIRRYVILFLIIASFSTRVWSQGNLVVNGSFEQITTCELESGDIEIAEGWTNLYSAELGVDLYAACSSNPFYSTPLHVWPGGQEEQQAYHGQNYVGFLSYSQFEAPLGSLQTSLVKDTVYNVSFQLNRSDYSGNAVAGLGLLFFDTVLTLPQSSYDTLLPVITEDDFISDSVNWIHVSELYIAKGSERYFAVGLFDTIVTLEIWPNGAAYYYLDNVDIHKATQSEINGIVYHALGFSVYPNPTIGPLRIESKEQLTGGWITELNGRRVQALKPSGINWEADVGRLASGIYLVEVYAEDGRKAVRKVVVN